MRDAIQEILEYNDPLYNYFKLAEELAELSEVVLKRALKNETHCPPLERLVEELGDCLFRMKVISRMEGIAMKVNERIQKKNEKLLEYIDKGKYKGRV